MTLPFLKQVPFFSCLDGMTGIRTSKFKVPFYIYMVEHSWDWKLNQIYILFDSPTLFARKPRVLRKKWSLQLTQSSSPSGLFHFVSLWPAKNRERGCSRDQGGMRLFQSFFPFFDHTESTCKLEPAHTPQKHSTSAGTYPITDDTTIFNHY